MKKILSYIFDRTVLRLVFYIFEKGSYKLSDFVYSFIYSEEDSRKGVVLNEIVRRLHNETFKYTNNLHTVFSERALQDSVDFVEKHLEDVLIMRSPYEIRSYAVAKIKRQKMDGACLEFGVFTGGTINYFAKCLPEVDFFGFDSFEGLAEDWKGHFIWEGSGHFDVKGKLPAVPSNVTLVQGWFDATLPEFCKNHLSKNSIRFIHIDCDTYESTLFVLETLAKRFKPGFLLLFDEFIGFPNWQNGEFRAWNEVSKKHGIKFRYLSFTSEQALIEVIN